MDEAEKARMLPGSGHWGALVPKHLVGKGGFSVWKLGGRGWEFDGDKKLLSLSSPFDVRSIFHASVAADKEGGGILHHPSCLLRTDLLLSVSNKAKALSVRLSGYTVEDMACNDVFWCTARLTGHFSRVCNTGALSCFSWWSFLSLTNHKKGNHGSIFPVS